MAHSVDGKAEKGVLEIPLLAIRANIRTVNSDL